MIKAYETSGKWRRGNRARNFNHGCKEIWRQSKQYEGFMIFQRKRSIALNGIMKSVAMNFTMPRWATFIPTIRWTNLHYPLPSPLHDSLSRALGCSFKKGFRVSYAWRRRAGIMIPHLHKNREIWFIIHAGNPSHCKEIPLVRPIQLHDWKLLTQGMGDFIARTHIRIRRISGKSRLHANPTKRIRNIPMDFWQMVGPDTGFDLITVVPTQGNTCVFLINSLMLSAGKRYF